MYLTSLFIDRGYLGKKNIPGFSSEFSLSAFPFWGEYSLLDFAYYNTILPVENSEIRRLLLCNKNVKKSAYASLSRWDDSMAELLPIDTEMDFVPELTSLLAGNYVLLYDINHAALISEAGKKQILEIASSLEKDEVIKLSINNVPVDIYLSPEKHFVKILEKNRQLFEKEKKYLEVLFDDIMIHVFDQTINVDGVVYFNSTITQFYENNIALLSAGKSDIMNKFLAAAPDPAEKDSFINKNSMVINSIISSNVKVEGYVENSIIFSDVVIKNNARIINSVILNGNQIGKDVVISNALVFPNTKNPGNISNIQEKSVIGGNSKKAANLTYPDQIYNGLTFLGANSNIPKNFTIEPGGFLGADVPAGKLKKNDKIARNGSLE
jgi:ADP-glucose pyrophosphorylase